MEGGLGGRGLRMERKRELGSLGYRDEMTTLWDHPGWLSPLCVSESRGPLLSAGQSTCGKVWGEDGPKAPGVLPTKVCMSLAPSCPISGNAMDRSPPGSSVYGVLQARILMWVAIALLQGIF